MNQSTQTVLEVVQAIDPFDQLEEQHQRDTLAWIESGVNIYRIQKPDVPPRHLVSYFVLYDVATELYLLVDHKLSGLWLPSGGHVEVGEDPAETVIRECREELGVEANFVSKTPRMITVTQTIGQAEHTDVSLWYLLSGSKDMTINWDRREFNGVRWWSQDEMQSFGVQHFDPHMQRFVSKIHSEIQKDVV